MIPADSRWRHWLEELAAEGKFASEDVIPFAMRGFEWRMQVIIDGDFSDYQLVGRVKATPNAPTNLAVMDVFGPTLFEGQTYWELSLPSGDGPGSTGAFPVGQIGDGVAKYPMLLVMVPPGGGAAYPLVGGLFTLLGAV